ncbi:MAG: YjbF family lipoprotein [Sulfitobacter sp.]
MRRMWKRGFGAALVAALLSACSSDNAGGPSLPLVLAGSAKDIVTSRDRGVLPKTVVSQADYAKITVPLLQVNPELRGGSDFLQRVAVRNDSAPGTVEIWESSDKAQVFLRDGIVVGSRGIGGDIIAAGANATLSALKRQGKGSGLREFIVSDGDVTTTKYEFRCDVENLGAERISVASQAFDTIHMQETCTVEGPELRVVRNDYWVQQPSGFVRKSRQWMGPRVGYFELLALKS